MERNARCQCGALAATVVGAPALVTACCCTWCQRRSGSAFSVASRWTADQVKSRNGASTKFTRAGDSGGRVTIHFCPTCSSTVFTELDTMPGYIGIPVGCFADPSFPAPQAVVWCDTKPDWLELPAGIPQLRDQAVPVGSKAR